MANLKKMMKAHLRMPFPAGVERGAEYGEVNSVLIDADIFGWALQASRGKLSRDDAYKLQISKDKLDRSLEYFPERARNYYESLVALASAALDKVT
jgi:hypothetical protein